MSDGSAVIDEDKRYDGFLSYSHATDGQLAPMLQTAVQRFAKPWWRRRALLIFRDQTGLTVNPHLWSSISEALDDSRWFILLCSPEAAGSEWVDREIRHWRDRHDVRHILPVLTDGEWVWDAAAGGFDLDASTAVPPALADAFEEEPRNLDLRWARTDEQLNLRNGRFRAAVAEVAAPMRGVPREDLESEEIRLHRRSIRWAWSAAVLLVVLSLTATVAAVAAVRSADTAQANAEEAQANADLATDRARTAESTRLAALALDEADAGLPDRALLLGVAAADAAGTDVGPARNALLAATGRADGLARVFSDPDIEPGTAELQSPVVVLGGDGDWAALADGAVVGPGATQSIAVVDLTGDGPRRRLGPVGGPVLEMVPVGADRLVVVFESQLAADVANGLVDDGSAGFPLQAAVFDTRSGDVLYEGSTDGRVAAVRDGGAVVVSDGGELTLVEIGDGRVGPTWPGRIAGDLARSPDGIAPARGATVAPRATNAVGDALAGYSPALGAQVRWDLDDPADPAILVPSSDPDVAPARFDPTGEHLVAVGDGGVVVIDDASGARVEIPAADVGPVIGFAVADRAERVVAVDRTGRVTVVDVGGATATTTATTNDEDSATWIVAVSRGGDWAVLTRTPALTLPDADGRQSWFTRLADGFTAGPLVGIPVGFDGAPGATTQVTMSRSGLPPTFGHVNLDTGEALDATTGFPVLEANGLVVGLPPAESARMAPGTATAAATPSTTTEALVLTPTAPPVSDALQPLPYGQRAVAFAVNDELVVGAAYDGQLLVWDRVTQPTSTPLASVSTLSADGAQLARVLPDLADPIGSTVEIVDLGTGESRRFAPPGGAADLLTFDPTGRWLAGATRGATDGGSSWIVDASDREARPTVVDSLSISFASDGAAMATWRRDGDRWTATISPVPGGDELGRVSGLVTNSPYESGPPASALDAGGARLAVRTEDGIEIFDVATGASTTTLEAPAAAMSDLVFADGALRAADLVRDVTVLRAWSTGGQQTGVAVIPSVDARLVVGPDGLLLAASRYPWPGQSAYLFAGPTLDEVGAVDSTYLGFRGDGSALVGVTSAPDGTPAPAVRPIDLESLAQEACRIAGRQMTTLEWQRFRPSTEQQDLCPERPGSGS